MSEAQREMTQKEIELYKGVDRRIIRIFAKRAKDDWERLVDLAMAIHKGMGKSKERAMADVLTEKSEIYKHLYQ